MAVVQISKIQVRRGQKNSNSGVPQLSSAEFAWAVDSQELYIGNGSVLEGAPYVGNTKILTEHDNILELAGSYQFASDDTAISLSIPRSLQSKLDEYVSVADFGAIGDGSTDCVLAFETAFAQLFKNANDNFKKILLIPNGEYLFTSGLAIPSGVILQGETQERTILNIGANTIRFVTSTGLEVADFNSSNRPQNIQLKNLIIQRTTGQTTFSGVANSLIENVTFRGDYVLGDNVSSLAAEPAAVFWNNDLSGIKVDNLKFVSCQFESNSIAVKCNQTTIFDTAIKFIDSKFFVSDTAVYINGVSTQGNRWQFNNCEFEEIAAQAFRSTNGQGTLIQSCKFKNVGNGTNTASNPTDVMVYFGERNNNLLIDCTSDRQQMAGITSSNLTASVTESFNSDNTRLIDRNNSQIFLSDSFKPLTVFSASNKYTIVNYRLSLGAHTRHGQLWISVGEDLVEGQSGTFCSLTDNYQYSPSLITNEGGALMTNFEFNVELRDNDNDSTIETIVLSYKNPLATGATGNISFDVTYGV